MDKFSKSKRSEIMSRVKGKNTSIEKLVFSYLRKRGVYHQRHYKNAPGSPDVALPTKKRAVFIEGGFWHGWNYKKLKPRLKTYWRNKIEGNMRRDRRNTRKLKTLGWKSMRVWDHQLAKNPDFWLQRIEDFLAES